MCLMVKNRLGRVVELKTATIEELTSNYLLKWSIFMKTVRLIVKNEFMFLIATYASLAILGITL